MASDIAPRLARNSGYFVIKSFVALAAMLLITPYILKTIGKDHYGIWALAGVMTSYAQLSDFGITESLVKYTAEYHAKKDSASLNRLVNTVLFSYLGIALAVGWGLFVSLPFVAAEILKIPAVLQPQAVEIYRLAVIVFLVNMLFGVFSSIIVGSQQIGFSTAIYIVSTLISAGGTIMFLQHGWGLRGLVINSAMVAVVTSMLNIAVASRLFPDLRINFLQFIDRAMLKQILNFSWKVQASSISHVMIFQIDRILLSRYLGLESVAYYEIGSTAASYARSFLAAVISPLCPAASELSARKEFSLITGLYNRSFKLIAMLALPLCLLVIALARPFIAVWVGPGFDLAAVTLQLLMPAYVINVLTGPGSFILNGINRPDISMRSALFAGVTNLFLCIFLVKTIGYFGLIIGISTSLVVSALYFAFMLHRVIPELKWDLYPPVFIKPLLLSTPFAVTLYCLTTWYDLADILSLAFLSCAYALLVSWMTLNSSYLDGFERGIIRGILPFGRRDH